MDDVLCNVLAQSVQVQVRDKPQMDAVALGQPDAVRAMGKNSGIQIGVGVHDGDHVTSRVSESVIDGRRLGERKVAEPLVAAPVFANDNFGVRKLCFPIRMKPVPMLNAQRVLRLEGDKNRKSLRHGRQSP